MRPLAGSAEIEPRSSAPFRTTVVAPFPLLLVVLELLLLLGLAANEYAGRSLEWNAA